MRYLITGGSGYIGTRLVDRLSRREDTERIVICDVAPPRTYVPKTEFQKVDVRDRQAVRAAVEGAKPDVLVHLAFILNPSHDEALHVRRGRERHAATCSTRQPPPASARCSSRPRPWPTAPSRTTRCRSPRTTRCAASRASRTRATRPSPTGSASSGRMSTRTASSRSCGRASSSAPTWTTTSSGSGRRRRSPRTSGTLDQQIQFVHEDDVVEAVTGLLLGRHGGAFNVAGDGLMTMRECGELIGAPVRKLPLWAYRALARRDVAAAGLRGAARADRLRALSVDRLEREDQADARLDTRALEPRDLRDHHAQARKDGSGAARRGPAARC